MTEYVVQNNDFSEFDNNKHVTFEREDRNGTRYYIDTKCPKCGGTGYISYYDHVEGGICFLCDGTGLHGTRYKVMTAEYYKKMCDRRLEKARKTAPERNAKAAKQWGLSENGEAWVVLGETFPMKDELKAAGARFSNHLGWHFDHEQDKYPVVKISRDDIIHEAADGTWVLNDGEDDKSRDIISKAQDDYRRAALPKTDYIGEIGERIEKVLTYLGCNCFEYHMRWNTRTTYLHKFEDENGNMVIWKTADCLDYEDKKGDYQPIKEGWQVKVRGTVKEHSEYRGRKQTALTRCKYSLVTEIQTENESQKAFDEFYEYLEA